jgi:hypothetical protein
VSLSFADENWILERRHTVSQAYIGNACDGISASCLDSKYGQSEILFKIDCYGPKSDYFLINFDEQGPERISVDDAGRISSAQVFVFDHVITQLKNHERVHLRFPDGRESEFSLTGSSQALRDCPSREELSATNTAHGSIVDVRSIDEQFSKLMGYWRYNYPDDVWQLGCGDIDNKYRLRIGRYNHNDREIAFSRSTGLPTLGFYENYCDLHWQDKKDSTLEAWAICWSPDSEYFGPLSIKIESDDRILVTQGDSTTELIRCP